MSQVFVKGEVVDLTIRGVRVVGFDEQAKHLTVKLPGSADGDGRLRIASVYLDSSTSVERVAPPEWPPRPGDVWRAAPQPPVYPRGRLLMYQHYINPQYRESQRFVPAFETGYQVWSAEQALRELGPLTLEYREPDPDPESTDVDDISSGEADQASAVASDIDGDAAGDAG